MMDSRANRSPITEARALLLSTYSEHELVPGESMDLNRIADASGVSLSGGAFREDKTLLAVMSREQQKIVYSSEHPYERVAYAIAHLVGSIRLSPQQNKELVTMSDLLSVGSKQSSVEHAHDLFAAYVLMPDETFNRHAYANYTSDGHWAWSDAGLAREHSTPVELVSFRRRHPDICSPFYEKHMAKMRNPLKHFVYFG